MSLNKMTFILMCSSTVLFSAKIGEIMSCETSTVSYEYVKCKEINKVVRVSDLTREGWIAINSHTFYITFKKIANSLDVMQCLESAQFPNYIGACKSNLFPKPKTWLKKDARSNGWKVNCAIGDTVFYYKMRQ
jgi:hypothetical protein